MEPAKKDFLELSNIGPAPIVEIPDARLRPSRETLDSIMESVK